MQSTLSVALATTTTTSKVGSSLSTFEHLAISNITFISSVLPVSQKDCHTKDLVFMYFPILSLSISSFCLSFSFDVCSQLPFFYSFWLFLSFCVPSPFSLSCPLLFHSLFSLSLLLFRFLFHILSFFILCFQSFYESNLFASLFLCHAPFCCFFYFIIFSLCLLRIYPFFLLSIHSFYSFYLSAYLFWCHAFFWCCFYFILFFLSLYLFQCLFSFSFFLFTLFKNSCISLYLFPFPSVMCL